MEKREIELESCIMAALFKATIEQTTMLTGNLKQRPKQLFVQWQKIGFQLLEEMEKNSITDEETLSKLADMYHAIDNKIRKDNQSYLKS